MDRNYEVLGGNCYPTSNFSWYFIFPCLKANACTDKVENKVQSILLFPASALNLQK